MAVLPAACKNARRFMSCPGVLFSFTQPSNHEEYRAASVVRQESSFGDVRRRSKTSAMPCCNAGSTRAPDQQREGRPSGDRLLKAKSGGSEERFEFLLCPFAAAGHHHHGHVAI